MNLKQYQQIKLGFVIVIAIIVSQSIIFKNYFIPVAVMIVGTLVLTILRRKVKGVMADERDYITGGKAAILAIQIYSWIAVVSMFIMLGLQDFNPAYEPIAVTLAFSTCVLMLLYAVIFRYYNKFSLTDKKFMYTAFVLGLFLALAVVGVRLFSGEDDWMCKNGEWVKHGQPDFPAPLVECK
ncbi:MAG: DUF2178 domain-containing protein [Candidatus Paceibacterota bacterium]